MSVHEPINIIEAQDALCEVRHFVEAIHMMATALSRDDCNAIQRVAMATMDAIRKTEAIFSGEAGEDE